MHNSWPCIRTEHFDTKKLIYYFNQFRYLKLRYLSHELASKQAFLTKNLFISIYVKFQAGLAASTKSPFTLTVTSSDNPPNASNIFSHINYSFINNIFHHEHLKQLTAWTYNARTRKHGFTTQLYHVHRVFTTHHELQHQLQEIREYQGCK